MATGTRKSLWLLLLLVVGLVVLGAAFFFASRPALQQPPALGGSGTAAATGALRPIVLGEPVQPAQPPGSLKGQLPVVQLTPEQRSRLQRVIPLPPQLSPGRQSTLADRPGMDVPDVPDLVDLTGKEPLPPEARWQPYQDPQGRFRLDLPADWSPRATEAVNAALVVGPATDPTGPVWAAVYFSKVPPSTFQLLQEKMVEAASMRGETVLERRAIRDGRVAGLELVTRVAGPAGPLRQRAFYMRRGTRLIQLLAQAPEDQFDRYSPYFRAMGRSLE